MKKNFPDFALELQRTKLNKLYGRKSLISTSASNSRMNQAGAELGQAQPQLELEVRIGG